MAELHIFGRIESAENFKKSILFCKWSFHTGSGWKLINGNSEGQTQECRDLYRKKLAWDHPIDLHYTTHTIQGSPKLLLQIFSRDNYGRILFTAYGTCSVPLTPGFHQITCHTWKPIGNWQDRLRDKFLVHCSTTENSISVTTCINDTGCQSISDDILTSALSTIEDINLVTEEVIKEWELNQKEMNTTKKVNISKIFPSFYPTSATNYNPVNKLSNDSITANINRQLIPVVKRNIDPCTCDFQMSRCDTNCCCDNDCTDFHLSVFSHCSDNKKTKYDSRYCYTKDFIRKNNTDFILERIADNLFCISHDNLPPIYSKSSAIKIGNRPEFDSMLTKELESKFTWLQELDVPLNFNTSNPYKVGDTLWTVKSKSYKPLGIFNSYVPIKGFTSHCSFRKSLIYLTDLETHCLQTKLNMNNSDIFTETYNNFTVISSPIFLNTTSYMSSVNQSCPKNICIPIETTYCLKAWSMCNTTSQLKPSCANGTCNNIVKQIRYTITHNGTMGIKSIKLYIVLGNFSDNYYQHFEVKYEWAGFYDDDIIYTSGNPGYITSKPIVIGTLMKSTSKNIVTEFIFLNKTNYQLTVPLGDNINNYCSEENRYTIKFNEDLKSKCLISFETNNLTVDTCNEIHKKIIAMYFKETLINVTSIENYKLYASKSGNVTNNNVTNWNQILLNKLPQQVITGQKINDKISCWNLISSIHIDILYSSLPKPDDDTPYHKIVGVAITLDERNITLSKCLTINCTNIIDHEINSFVKFYDVSIPDSYYFAGGPNLDISLPYDFFYPFMSGSSSYKLNLIVIIVTVIISTFII
ncbi:tectonic-1 isoform X2 [Microplitis demolitor]|uniref:tectonic-1 isoform X2 n=1 Tax=Microplitis demolitor TaxID=69319 RepID=UPI0004CCE949|nr:tectonic-1 isoform X2 [Microplitis demolitor]